MQNGGRNLALITCKFYIKDLLKFQRKFFLDIVSGNVLLYIHCTGYMRFLSDMTLSLKSSTQGEKSVNGNNLNRARSVHEKGSKK